MNVTGFQNNRQPFKSVSGQFQGAEHREVHDYGSIAPVGDGRKT